MNGPTLELGVPLPAQDLAALAEFLRGALMRRAAELPLERLLDAGGWPDLATLTLQVRDLTPQDGVLHGALVCAFQTAAADGCAVVRTDVAGVLPFTVASARGQIRF